MQPMAKSIARQPRKWTAQEDQKLRDEVEAQRNEGEIKDWCRIATALPGRTNKDCRKRWTNSVAGGLRKGVWAQHEDALLARGVERFGQRWTLVADVVATRSADQCAKRWQQSLNPELDRSEWREAEDKVLIAAVRKMGRHWKDVQRHHFQGRSKNSIKNRYTVLLRRYQNLGIQLPEGMVPGAQKSSLTDDDDISHASSANEDVLSTQVSTPETPLTWPPDETSFWPPQPPINWTLAAVSVDCNHPPTTASASPHWNWPTTSVQQPTMMDTDCTTTYADIFTVPVTSTYLQFNPTPFALENTSSPSMAPSSHTSFLELHSMPPTSTPRPDAAVPYQQAESFNRFMRHGTQGQLPYTHYTGS